MESVALVIGAWPNPRLIPSKEIRYDLSLSSLVTKLVSSLPGSSIAALTVTRVAVMAYHSLLQSTCGRGISKYRESFNTDLRKLKLNVVRVSATWKEELRDG